MTIQKLKKQRSKGLTELIEKYLGDKILFSLKISFDVILFIEFIEDNIPECVYGNLKNSK